MRNFGYILLCGALFAFANGDSRNPPDSRENMMNRVDNGGGQDGGGGGGGNGGGDGNGQGGGNGGDGPPPRPPPERVYTFALAKIDPPYTYVDEEHMKVVGMSIDLMHEVCEMADRRCELIFLKDRDLCWNPEGGYSPGLMTKMFDACVNAMPDFEKEAVNAFSRSFAHAPVAALLRRQNDDLIFEDILRDNQIPIGFVRMSPINRNCLMMNGAMLNPENVREYENERDLLMALNNGDIRLAFTRRMPMGGDGPEGDNPDTRNLEELETREPLRCAADGPAVMMRKDNHELMDWLNPTLERVLNEPEYPRLCYIWEKISGRPTNCNMQDDMDGPGGMMPRGD